MLWSEEHSRVSPLSVRVRCLTVLELQNSEEHWLQDAIATYAPDLMDQDQQDAQELLAFLISAVHEELNQAHGSFKTLTEKQSAALEKLPRKEASDSEWRRGLQSDNSPVSYL